MGKRSMSHHHEIYPDTVQYRALEQEAGLLVSTQPCEPLLNAGLWKATPPTQTSAASRLKWG